jgi:hypothetical protein
VKVRKNLLLVKGNGFYGFYDLVGRCLFPVCLEEVSSDWLRFTDSNSTLIDLIPVKYNGYWGYLDSNFEWALLPKSDEAYPFNLGNTACVKVGKVYHIVNRQGEIVNPYKLVDVVNKTKWKDVPFLVLLEDGTYGLLNDEGHWVGDSNYTAVAGNSFSYPCKVGLVQVDYDKWYIITKNGKLELATNLGAGDSSCYKYEFEVKHPYEYYLNHDLEVRLVALS